MNKTLFSILALIAVVLLVVFVVLPQRGEDTEDVEDTFASYQNEEFEFSFDYRTEPDGYTLVEVEEEARGERIFALNLFDTDEYEELLKAIEEGTPREGPPSIGVEVFDMGESSNIEQWIQDNPQLSNLGQGGSPAQFDEMEVDGVEGRTYLWDGLYTGKSIALPYGENAVVLSVTYLTTEDDIRTYFDTFVDSFEFTGNNATTTTE